MRNLDPRTKIVIIACISAIAMMTKRLEFLAGLLAAVVILMLLMGIGVRRLKKQLAGVMGMVLFLFILQAVFGQWELGLVLCIRLLILLMSALILLTGQPRDYLLAMVQCHLPYELAYMVILAFHFFPLLREEAMDIYYSMQLRGTELKKTSVKNKLRAYKGMCIPIIAGAMKRAEDTATAMEARGFRSSRRRTYIDRLRLRKADVVIMILVPVLSVGFVFGAHNISIPEGEFLVAGDVQYSIRDRDYEVWGDFMGEAKEDHENADFIIFTGDMVNNVSDDKDWDAFFTNERKAFGDLKVYTAPGNHETCIDQEEYLERIKAEGEYYSFDYGNCHIVSLNSCIFMKERKKTEGYEEELAEVNSWLKDDLAKSDARFKLVFMHHPPYPVAEDSEIYGDIRDNWEKIFIDEGVDVCFCGHQHVYMRTSEINGVTYIMSRSGQKASRYLDENGDVPEYVDEIYLEPVYLVVKDMGSSLMIEAVNEKGSCVDRVRVR